MKKILALVLCVLVASMTIGTMFTVSAVGTDGVIDAIEAKTAPEIDGFDDDAVWADAKEVEVVKFGSNIYPATSTPAANEKTPVAYGKVKVAWDAKYIYVIAKIYDTTPWRTSSKAKPEDCDYDSIDFQLSEQGYGLDQGMRDDTVGAGNKLPGNGIFNVNINGKVTGWGGIWYADKGDEKATGAAQVTEYGYCTEIAIPLQTITGELGTIVGMEFQINDNQSGEGRTAIRQWSCDQCEAHSNTKWLGKVTFVAAPEVVIAPPAEEKPTTNPTTPATADLGIVIALVAAASGTGLVLGKKRK